MSEPAVPALLHKARASIDAARLLIDAGHFDSAASRAYNAMFYIAEVLLAAIGQSYSRHASVIAAFGREYAKTGILDSKFHRWLIDAQDLRNAADYGAEVVIPEEKVRMACTWAEQFLDAARGQLAEGRPPDSAG